MNSVHMSEILIALKNLTKALDSYKSSFEFVIGSSLPEPLNTALQEANALLSRISDSAE